MGASPSTLENLVINGDVSDLKKQLAQLKSNPESSAPEENQLIQALLLSASNRSRPIQKLQCMIELLTEAGANVNGSDSAGWTCLHHACASSNLSLIPFLVSKGATVERDIHGLLPQNLISPRKLRSTGQSNNQNEVEESLNAAIFALNHISDKKEYDLVVSCKEGNSDANQHELGSPILIKYTSKVKPLSSRGYIQLMYHDSGKSLAEEPHYSNYVSISGSSNEGVVQFETQEIPNGAICHFVYVQCDKSMMIRRVVASTNGIVLQTGVSKYHLSVAGVKFYHSSPNLSGKEFANTGEFKEFVSKQKNAFSKDSRFETDPSSEPADLNTEIGSPKVNETN